jgi:hypothetical protein
VVRRVVLLVLVIDLVGFAPVTAKELPRRQLISDGLEFEVINWGRPLNVVHVARVQPVAALGLKVLPALPEKGLERPSEICARYPGECLAAVNGDMFDRKARQPLGGMVVDGEVLQPFRPNYRQLNLTATRQAVITLDGALPPGTRQSIGTSYPVLLDGRPTSIQEDTSFVWGAEARTLVGWNQAGEFFLVTVDQGKGYSRGVSLTQAAELMLEIGATEAVNLDGGESTTFVLSGEVKNKPWSGEQEVSNILAVVLRPPEPVPTRQHHSRVLEAATFQRSEPVKALALAMVVIAAMFWAWQRKYNS